MAITLVSKNVHIGRVPMGQNGRVFCWAEFAFSTTDASGTIQCPLRTCDLVMLTLAAAPNTDEDVYVSEAANTTNGVINVQNQTLTIARTGTKTSGLKFYVLMVGQAL